MIRVNLLANAPGTTPARDWLPREQRSAAIGLSMLLVTALGSGAYWWHLTNQRAATDQAIAESEATLASLKTAVQLLDRANARKAELGERLGLIDRLRAGKRAPVSLLETVSMSVPEGLWLLEIKQIGTAVQIEGRATSLTSVTDFTQRMQNSGLFKPPVEILTTTTELLEEMSIVRFAIKAEAVPPQAPAPATAATTSAVPGQAGM
jgi:type IV pilus assembly protein PilN